MNFIYYLISIHLTPHSALKIMKNILFPSCFRLIGWILFVPAIIAGALSYFSVLTPTGMLETVVNDAILIGIVLGALFIICSKERYEDEMIRAIRLSSILNAIYANVIVFIAGTLFINGGEYLGFVTFNLGLLPLIFVFIYTAEMHRHLKQSEEDEE